MQHQQPTSIEAMCVAIFMQVAGIVYTLTMHTHYIVPYKIERGDPMWWWLAIPAFFLTFGSMIIMIVTLLRRFGGNVRTDWPEQD